MNSIERRIENLEERASGGEIRSFEDFMAECVKVTDALASGVRLDTLRLKRFHPSMRAGIVKSLPDLERAMHEAQETLPLEITAQLILIYRDPDTRSLLTPTLKELVERILELERAGKLAVAAD
jgi:uncharacterized coiled-coil protein SlyX